MSLTVIRFIPVRNRISRRGRLSWVTPTSLKQSRLIPFWFLHLASLTKASPNKNSSFYIALHHECTDPFSWLLFYILAKNSTFHRTTSFSAHEAAMLILRATIMWQKVANQRLAGCKCCLVTSLLTVLWFSCKDRLNLGSVSRFIRFGFG